MLSLFYRADQINNVLVIHLEGRVLIIHLEGRNLVIHLKGRVLVIYLEGRVLVIHLEGRVLVIHLEGRNLIRVYTLSKLNLFLFKQVSSKISSNGDINLNINLKRAIAIKMTGSSSTCAEVTQHLPKRLPSENASLKLGNLYKRLYPYCNVLDDEYHFVR